MRLLTGILGLLLLAGCMQTSTVTDTLLKADSMNIQFANSTTNSLSTDPIAIDRFARLIGRREKRLPLECEAKPAGMIYFYQKGQLQQEVTFTDLTQNCRYFIVNMDGKTTYWEIGNEAVHFLTTMRQDRRPE